MPAISQRERLTTEWLNVDTEVVVHDAVEGPNPLVARRHDIVIRPERGALEVTETIRVDNPTSTCYAGRTPQEGTEPVTLQLAIPAAFERITFDQKSFGRNFSMQGEKLVTGIRRPPGKEASAAKDLHSHLGGDRLCRSGGCVPSPAHSFAKRGRA